VIRFFAKIITKFNVNWSAVTLSTINFPVPILRDFEPLRNIT
jgi:hypothetical protein